MNGSVAMFKEAARQNGLLLVGVLPGSGMMEASHQMRVVVALQSERYADVATGFVVNMLAGLHSSVLDSFMEDARERLEARVAELERVRMPEPSAFQPGGDGAAIRAQRENRILRDMMANLPGPMLRTSMEFHADGYTNVTVTLPHDEGGERAAAACIVAQLRNLAPFFFGMEDKMRGEFMAVVDGLDSQVGAGPEVERLTAELRQLIAGSPEQDAADSSVPE